MEPTGRELAVYFERALRAGEEGAFYLSPEGERLIAALPALCAGVDQEPSRPGHPWDWIILTMILPRFAQRVDSMPEGAERLSGEAYLQGLMPDPALKFDAKSERAQEGHGSALMKLIRLKGRLESFFKACETAKVRPGAAEGWPLNEPSWASYIEAARERAVLEEVAAEREGLKGAAGEARWLGGLRRL